MSVITPGLIVTPAGAAAIASSIAGAPVALSHVAWGDAAGLPYQPTGAETALVHEVVRVAVDSVIPDPAHADQVIVQATLGTGVGGFTVREVALYTAGGALAAIGAANISKSWAADGVLTSLVLRARLKIAPGAQITVEVDDSALVTREWVLQHRQFFAVRSATATAPPATPLAEDQYLIPVGATGAWAGKTGQVAIWRNDADGWLYVTPPAGARAEAADTRLGWLKTTTDGWILTGAGFGAETTKASAATCDLGSAASHLVKITGSAAISSFGASADLNAPVFIGRFTGAPLLASSAGLQLPGAADIQAAPGDAFAALYLGGGAWRVLIYQPAAGYDRKGDAAAAQAAANAYTAGVAALLAPRVSPVLAGTPESPTPPVGTNTNQIATMAAIQQAIAALIGMAPAALDTWGELVAAIQADQSGLAALTATVGGKVNRSGDTMTGDLLGIDPPNRGDKSGRLATTRWLRSLGMSVDGFVGVGATGTVNLTAADHVGKAVVATSGGVTSFILPDSATVPSGMCVLLQMNGATSGSIAAPVGSYIEGYGSPLTLRPGAGVLLACYGGSSAAGWFVVSLHDLASVGGKVNRSGDVMTGGLAAPYLESYGQLRAAAGNGNGFNLAGVSALYNDGGNNIGLNAAPAKGLYLQIAFATVLELLSTSATFAVPVSAPTAPRSANDTRLGTTAFHKSVGQRINAQSIVSSSRAIAASEAGGLIYFTGAGAIATLPSAATVEVGSILTFYNYTGGTCYVQAAAGQAALGATGPIPVHPGATLACQSQGTDYFNPVIDPRVSGGKYELVGTQAITSPVASLYFSFATAAYSRLLYIGKNITASSNPQVRFGMVNSQGTPFVCPGFSSLGAPMLDVVVSVEGAHLDVSVSTVAVQASTAAGMGSGGGAAGTAGQAGSHSGGVQGIYIETTSPGSVNFTGGSVALYGVRA